MLFTSDTQADSEALLLGTRLIILGPHCEGRQESNVLLDMPLPQSSDTISERKLSREFQELREFVKQRAYGSSSRDEYQPVRELHGRGDSL